MYRIKCSKCYLNSVIVNELHNISTKYARHQETDWFENRTVAVDSPGPKFRADAFVSPPASPCSKFR